MLNENIQFNIDCEMRKTKPSDKDGGDDDEKSTSSANKRLIFLLCSKSLITRNHIYQQHGN